MSIGLRGLYTKKVRPLLVTRWPSTHELALDPRTSEKTPCSHRPATRELAKNNSPKPPRDHRPFKLSNDFGEYLLVCFLFFLLHCFLFFLLFCISAFSFRTLSFSPSLCDARFSLVPHSASSALPLQEIVRPAALCSTRLLNSLILVFPALPLQEIVMPTPFYLPAQLRNPVCCPTLLYK